MFLRAIVWDATHSRCGQPASGSSFQLTSALPRVIVSRGEGQRRGCVGAEAVRVHSTRGLLSSRLDQKSSSFWLALPRAGVFFFLQAMPNREHARVTISTHVANDDAR